MRDAMNRMTIVNVYTDGSRELNEGIVEFETPTYSGHAAFSVWQREMDPLSPGGADVETADFLPGRQRLAIDAKRLQSAKRR
jgi:hypothetical protein